MWEIKIEKIDNGYILSHEEEREEDKKVTIKEVIEEGDDEKEAITKLLYQIAEYFGFHYDKYAKYNLKIIWNKKGHKHD